MNNGCENLMNDYQRLSQDHEHYLVSRQHSDRFDPGWFRPGWWQTDAEAVDAGGRGGAWFVHQDSCDWVLRQYLRGGVMARLSRAAYLFTGEPSVRSFCEFILLQELTRLGLPVAAPVAAMYRRRQLPVYEAAIIIERIEGAKPMGTAAEYLDAEAWSRVGRTIRLFHDHGVYHADLNCFNILIRGQEVYLIDFDKGELRHPSGGWRAANIERLRRSFNKLAWVSVQGDLFRQRWGALLDGYGRAAA